MIRTTQVYMIICLLSLTQGCGQEMSLGLSIEWRKAESGLPVSSLRFKSVKQIPYLKLTYKNLTGRDLYVKKPFDGQGSQPPLSMTFTLPTKLETETDCEQLFSSLPETDYKVQIRSSWEVSTLSFDTSREHEPDPINDQLLEIYEILDVQASLNALGMRQQLPCFNDPDKGEISFRSARQLIFKEKKSLGIIEPLAMTYPSRPLNAEEIAGEFSEAFVFLRAGEVYEQEISLAAFQLVGGNYEFMLSEESFQPHVIGKDGQRYNLPSQVNGFQLYDKAFLTNQLKITFN